MEDLECRRWWRKKNKHLTLGFVDATPDRTSVFVSYENVQHVHCQVLHHQGFHLSTTVRRRRLVLTVEGGRRRNIGIMVNRHLVVEGARRDEWKNRYILAIADLNHIPIRIMEEYLIHNYPSFSHYRLHILDLHLLQLLHNQIHIRALERDVIVLGVYFDFPLFW